MNHINLNIIAAARGGNKLSDVLADSLFMPKCYCLSVVYNNSLRLTFFGSQGKWYLGDTTKEANDKQVQFNYKQLRCFIKHIYNTGWVSTFELIEMRSSKVMLYKNYL